ncbi:response regulator transcription factor [Streptomyces sp. UNOC14_S4]|uniref:response regulator transcription factor n=1 Tax=Streptomyces sp. UNOC14_S4 TaxID=2872340 RepID=UPI001E3C1CA3|nr:helix-turn-helix transcriptional regulator [Streptomyces sp. UNOC14_S4]
MNGVIETTRHQRNSSGHAFGWASLTPAELRVARLVSEGLTNRAAAAVLSVSPHTVDSHLRHVFTKLEISNRVALARFVFAHDIPETGNVAA